MSIEEAWASINEALDKAHNGETLEISPTEHDVSTLELSDLADEEIAERGGGFGTEWLKNGSLVCRRSGTGVKGRDVAGLWRDEAAKT